MTQFDSTHIFQLGWFNHRLDDVLTGLIVLIVSIHEQHMTVQGLQG